MPEGMTSTEQADRIIMAIMLDPKAIAESEWQRDYGIAYRLWVNKERTIRVELWPEGHGGEDMVLVAIRDDPGDIWPPPIKLTEEKTKDKSPGNDYSRARIEQEVENEAVRRLQREGRCPICGAEEKTT